jgi:hypothetical protein
LHLSARGLDRDTLAPFLGQTTASKSPLLPH